MFSYILSETVGGDVASNVTYAIHYYTQCDTLCINEKVKIQPG